MTQSANFPGRPFRLEITVTLVSQDASLNRSYVQVDAWIHKNSYSPSYSPSAISSFETIVNGSRVAAASFGFDFRSANSMQLSTGVYPIAHNADGNFTVGAAVYCSADLLGYAAVAEFLALPRIAQTPAAPNVIGIDQVGPTSLRYRFTDGADGGSPINGRQVQYSTSSTFVGAEGNVISSDGTSTLNGLTPGIEYYLRSRNSNVRGWGPYSTVSSARTTSGAKVRVGGSWVTASIWVKVNGVWKIALPFVKHSDEWEPAA